MMNNSSLLVTFDLGVAFFFFNNHKGVRMMCSNTKYWDIEEILKSNIYGVIVLFHCSWVKNENNIEATLLANEMTLVFYLQIFITYCMSLMNLLFFLHKFNRFFFKMIKRH